MTNPVKHVPKEFVQIDTDPDSKETNPENRKMVTIKLPASPDNEEDKTVYDKIVLPKDSNVRTVTIIADGLDTPETITVDESGVIEFSPNIVTGSLVIKPTAIDGNKPVNLHLQIHACIEGNLWFTTYISKTAENT